VTTNVIPVCAQWPVPRVVLVAVYVVVWRRHDQHPRTEHGTRVIFAIVQGTRGSISLGQCHPGTHGQDRQTDKRIRRLDRFISVKTKEAIITRNSRLSPLVYQYDQSFSLASCWCDSWPDPGRHNQPVLFLSLALYSLTLYTPA